MPRYWLHYTIEAGLSASSVTYRCHVVPSSPQQCFFSFATPLSLRLHRLFPPAPPLNPLPWFSTPAPERTATLSLNEEKPSDKPASWEELFGGDYRRRGWAVAEEDAEGGFRPRLRRARCLHPWGSRCRASAVARFRLFDRRRWEAQLWSATAPMHEPTTAWRTTRSCCAVTGNRGRGADLGWTAAWR